MAEAVPERVQIKAFEAPDEWYVSVLTSDGTWTLLTVCATAEQAEVVAGVLRDGIAAALRAERERAERAEARLAELQDGLEQWRAAAERVRQIDEAPRRW